MIGTHTLVRIEAMTEEEIARQSSDVKKTLKGGPWHPPAPVKVPPPPDYSTPAKVTARCLERGTGAGADILAASRDTSVRKAYRALIEAAGAIPVRAEDLHASAWRVVPMEQGKPWHGWTLERVPEPPAPVAVVVELDAWRRKKAAGSTPPAIGAAVTIRARYGFEYGDPIDFRRAPAEGKRFTVSAIKGQRVYGHDETGRGLHTNLDCLEG